MQIAILICSNDSFTLCKDKVSDRFFTGAEILLLITLGCLQNDPHDPGGKSLHAHLPTCAKEECCVDRVQVNSEQSG